NLIATSFSLTPCQWMRIINTSFFLASKDLYIFSVCLLFSQICLSYLFSLSEIIQYVYWTYSESNIDLNCKFPMPI
ncbi:hypothetical protein, partial [uncultured Gilliamella sp.]|uniref:hypothetical protein n=1 Tax=uncultured Gilliamella sp. TaxID=1193505 RepID=UPI0025D37CB8